MGVASSNLPAMAAIGLEVFIWPLVGSMWFNTRCLSGWAVAGTFVYLWFLIRVGFDLYDPLQTVPLFSNEFLQSEAIYFKYYPILILVSLLVGWFICLLMDIREPIGFYMLWPSFSTRNPNNVVSTPCRPVDKEKLRAYYCMCNKGLQRHCFAYIETPYIHILVGVLLVLFTFILPAFLFWYLMSVNKYAAFFVGLGMRVIGYVLAWFFWSYRTDLAVWGPSEYNMKMRLEAARNDPDNSIYAEDPDITGIEWALYAETQSVVTKNVLVIGLIDVLGFLLLGGLIVFPSVADVDVVWIVGLSLVLFLALIFVIIGIVFYTRQGLEPLCPRVCPYTGKPLGAKQPLSQQQQQQQPLTMQAHLRNGDNQLVAKTGNSLSYRGNKIDKFFSNI